MLVSVFGQSSEPDQEQRHYGSNGTNSSRPQDPEPKELQRVGVPQHYESVAPGDRCNQPHRKAPDPGPRHLHRASIRRADFEPRGARGWPDHGHILAPGAENSVTRASGSVLSSSSPVTRIAPLSNQGDG